MISNNQQQVLQLLVSAISNSIHGSSNKNQFRHGFAQQASQGNWTGPIMDDLARLGLLLYARYTNGEYGALPAGVTDADIVDAIVNTNLRIVDLYYATWCIQQGAQLPQREQQEAQYAKQQFIDLAQSVGYFNQQQPQQQMGGYGPQQSNLATPGFQIGHRQQGGYGTNIPTNTPSTMTSTGISSKVTIMGVDGPQQPPQTTQTVQQTSVAQPEQDDFVEPITQTPVPDVSDKVAWLSYHGEMLCDLGRYGPDWTSPRPYDMFLVDEDDGNINIWIPAHLSPYEMDPGPHGPFPKVYSPSHSVRFIVFTRDGRAYEDYLHVEDNPDIRYLALEQGAAPQDIKRSGLSELGKLVSRITTTPAKFDTKKEPKEQIKESSPLSEALEEIALMINPTANPAVIVTSREEGELYSTINSKGDTGVGCYLHCSPYFLSEAEQEFISEIEEASSISEISKLFSKYDNPSVELRRVYNLMNRRFTEYFNPIFEYEFGMAFDSFADDLTELLTAILHNHGNPTLQEFTRATRDHVAFASGLMDSARTSQCLYEAMGIKPEELPSDRKVIVIADTRVVVNVPLYSNAIEFHVTTSPSLLDPGAIGLSAGARSVIAGIIDAFEAAESDYGNCMMYIRTLDDARLEIKRSIMNPESVTIRLI